MKQKEVTTEAQVAGFIDRYGKHMVLAGLAVVVLAGAYLLLGAFQKSQEKKAQEELFAVQKKIEKITEQLKASEEKPVETKAADAKAAKKTVEAKVEPKTKESLEKNYGEALKEADAFIDSHASRAAGAMAAVQVAGLAIAHQDYDRAVTTLNKVVKNVGQAELFYGLIRAQLGSALMDLKKYPEAAALFEEILNNKKQTYFHPQALLRLGTCYLESGDFDKAESTFTRLEADHPTTQAAAEAKNFKRIVTLRKAEKAS